MLNKYARHLATRLFTPVAAGLLRLGVSPDTVTTVGTIGVCVAALVFFPRDQLFIGVVVIALFALSDAVDGIMARRQGRSAKWGAYLDSTLDRFADAAVFSGLILRYTLPDGDRLTAALSLLCLVLGFGVSYARARAEGLGMTASGGIAERADRLVAILIAAGAVGLGAPLIWLTGTLAVLAVASALTIAARMRTVYRQSRTQGQTAR
jgi:CDP-diacylglycerol--glycerol-3-phosphate 3-phosphatidyltransferase